MSIGLTGLLTVHLPTFRPHPNPRRLTATETWVMDLVVTHAMSTREIVAETGISEATVKKHLTSIMNKTGYSTKLELAVRTLQKVVADDKSGKADIDFFRAVNTHLRGLSKEQCSWLLEAIELYCVKLRSGKIPPKSVGGFA
jgi:DNA-binding CsgD family transcriptional regulator